MGRRVFLSVLAVSWCAGAAASAQDVTRWLGEPGAAGDWFADENWSAGAPTDFFPLALIDNGGTAAIAAGASHPSTVRIAQQHSGTLLITGGTLHSHYSTLLGEEDGSHGMLQLEGGEFITGGQLDVGHGLGDGTVTHVGGRLQANEVSLGYWSWPNNGAPGDFATGHYDLIGGRLSAQNVNVGIAGTGRFRQEGGAAAIARRLTVGGVVGEIPPLDDLDLFRPEFVSLRRAAMSPAATSNHDVQPTAASLSLDVWFPPPTPSDGLYELAGGTLSSREIVVQRTGVFRQSGGGYQSAYVDVHPGGQYEYLGGSLTVGSGLNVGGSFDFGGTSATLRAGNAIVNFAQGLAGAAHARIETGPESLTIFPANFDPAVELGSYVGQGLVHHAGSDLTLARERTVRGWGNINDHVIASGTIDANDEGFINLNGGLVLNPNAEVDLAGGTVQARGDRTVIRGGHLSADGMSVIGTFDLSTPSPPGVIVPVAVSLGLARQSGGSIDVRRLSVDDGRYELSGGHVTADSIDVGGGPSLGFSNLPATFVQTGGQVEAARVTLHPVFFYPYLTANPLTDLTTAPPEQRRGDAVLAPFWPADFGGLATYELHDGSLLAEQLTIGTGLSGNESRFVQTGGQVIATHAVRLYGGASSYTMYGGSLHTRRLHVGGTYQSLQRDGTLAILDKDSEINVAGELLLGVNANLAAVPETTIRLTRPADLSDWPTLEGNAVVIHSTDSDALSGLSNLTLVFEGGAELPSTLEVAGADFGPGRGGFFQNFALDALEVGGVEAATLSLVDRVDNQLDGVGNEALYVEHLIIGPGSTLHLNGINLYYLTAIIADGALVEGNHFDLADVPEPCAAALAALACCLGVNWRRGSFPRREGKGDVKA